MLSRKRCNQSSLLREQVIDALDRAISGEEGIPATS